MQKLSNFLLLVALWATVAGANVTHKTDVNISPDHRTLVTLEIILDCKLSNMTLAVCSNGYMLMGSIPLNQKVNVIREFDDGTPSVESFGAPQVLKEFPEYVFVNFKHPLNSKAKRITIKGQDLIVGTYKLGLKSYLTTRGSQASSARGREDDCIEASVTIRYPTLPIGRFEMVGYKQISQRADGDQMVRQFVHDCSDPKLPTSYLSYTQFSDDAAVAETMEKIYSMPDAKLSQELATNVFGSQLLSLLAKPAAERAAYASNWVHKNIRSDFLRPDEMGDGVTPMPPSKTLSGKRSDCKGKSMLLSYLLKALNIEHEYVLVGLKGRNALPKLPVAEKYDHVMLHVPVLNQYVDTMQPTSYMFKTPIDVPVLHLTSRKSSSIKADVQSK